LTDGERQVVPGNLLTIAREFLHTRSEFLNSCLRKATLAAIAILTALTAGSVAHAQSVLASDNFNRANETPFATTGNWGRVIAGNYDGVANLINNQVRSSSNEGSYYWKGTGAFDPTRQFSRAKVIQKDGEVGMTLLAGPNQAIMVAWGPPGVGDTVYIYWYSGGSDRGQLATGPSTINNGDIIEASLENGIISAKVNGVTVRSVANTTTLTSGVPGFITFRDTSLPFIGIVDDWEAGTPQSYGVGGSITENGSPLGGVLVTASGGFSGSATTNGAGAYTIPGAPAGATSIVLTPTLSGHTMSPLTRTIAGPLAGNVTNADFTSTLNSTAALTVNATHGSVSRNPDQPTYAFGTDVTLTATPDTGYEFSSWSGDVPSGHETDNPLHVIMSADRTLTAHFTSPGVVASDSFNRVNETPLTVGGVWQRSLGSGLANLVGQHVAGASGEAMYYWQGPGTFDPSRQFARVKAIGTGGQVGLVLMGANQQGIVVAWNAGTVFIYWYKNGSNQGELAQAPSTINDGDVLEAVVDAGVIYARVNGAIVKSVANTTTLTLGQPGLETYLTGGALDDWEAGTPDSFSISGTISKDAAGLGGVSVTASGGFVGSATTNGNGLYTIPGVPVGATSIVLTPTFPGHTMSPTSRTVPGPTADNVTGMDFTATLNTTAALTVLSSHGTVTKDPDQSIYPLGTVVTLTPYPDGGFEFAGWSGDVPAGHGADNPLLVTMNQDRTIAANFVTAGFVAADYFNRADEAPLVVGGNWQRSFIGGLVNLFNNRITGDNGEAVYYWQGSGVFDPARQFARVRVVQAGGQVGIVLLGADNQALVTAWGAGNLYIYWYVSGAYQGELARLSSTLNDGDLIEAELNQGRVYAKVNGVVVASVLNTTSLTSGKPGFESFLTGQVFDDWEAGIPPFTCVGAANGTPCTDGNTCTQSDSCQNDVCVGTNPVVCSASDPCHAAGGCDSQTGACSNPVAANGTSCNDGNPCTSGDACNSGICDGAPVPPPAEISGIMIQGHGPTALSWTAIEGAVYDVATATLAELLANGTDSATCLADNLTSPGYVDVRPGPVPDGGLYYLIRAQNACGAGSYGSFSEGGQRFPDAACP